MVHWDSLIQYCTHIDWLAYHFQWWNALSIGTMQSILKYPKTGLEVE